MPTTTTPSSYRPPFSHTSRWSMSRATKMLHSSWNAIWNDCGRCYILSKPKDNTHNCPWNDLVPPSELRRCFEVVNAAIAVPPSKSSVRARLCSLANANISVQHVTLVWLTVEDKVSKPTLILRWGRRARRNGGASALHFAHRSARGDAEGTLEGLQRISLSQV